MAANEGVLGELHELIARNLAARIESGEATASDLAVAVKFLKDNNITCIPAGDNALGELEEKLKTRKSKRTALTQADVDAAMQASGLLN